MIISHQHRYMFVEVPHTATTAISKELCQKYGGTRILHKHANYFEFLKQATRAERRYFVFAGVRNPLDLVYTEYSKYLSNHLGAFTSRDSNGKWVTDEHAARFTHVQKHQDFPLFLQTFYNAVYHNWFLVGNNRFNSILRFESVQADFEQVLEKLEIQSQGSIPVSNKSKRETDFVDAYNTDEIRQHAARMFGPFMMRWGYQFPTAWNINSVPSKSRLAFHTREFVGSCAFRYLGDPRSNALVQRVKRFMDGFG